MKLLKLGIGYSYHNSLSIKADTFASIPPLRGAGGCKNLINASK